MRIACTKEGFNGRKRIQMLEPYKTGQQKHYKMGEQFETLGSNAQEQMVGCGMIDERNKPILRHPGLK